MSSKHFEFSLQKSLEMVPASVCFLRLCCSFRFRYSLTILLNLHQPAPILLATGTTTSPTPLMVSVIQLVETDSTKTPTTDCTKQFKSLYSLGLCF